MITKILNWLSGMTWSSSPHGMGCVYEKCIRWEECKIAKRCLHIYDKKWDSDE